MFEKITLKRNYLQTNKKKAAFLLIFFMFILGGYLIYINSFSDKRIAANNGNATDSSINSTEKQTEEDFSIVDKNENQDMHLFNNNLIDDNRGVPVLYYHSVNESVKNEVIISPDNLRKQLQYVKEQGYTTLTITELSNYLLNDSPIPEKSIVITFDDGYMDNYYNAYPILKDLHMVATIFCITSNLDGSYYLSKEAIEDMSNYGIDIESHTVNHPELDKIPYEDQLKELTESKNSLEAITGKKVTSIAYPFGDFNDNTIKAAKNAGYTLGFTTKRGFSDRNDNLLKLDRIYISSDYGMETFKEVLNNTER